MKKGFLFSLLLLASVSCGKDDTASSQQPSGTPADYEPHFYGIATLDDPAPKSRGAADGMKVWSKPMAENNLTVKFLNGDSTYRAFVRETAREWEKYAGVKFHFVADDQDALIRVGFDYIRGMMSSWAYTGTDHMQLYDRQNEATVHFARLNRVSNAQRRGDVLRAFGQVLGLELEYRRPDFDAQWLDEKTVENYWTDELASFISWEELKKYVYDPISQFDFAIYETAAYDPESIMTWPFYALIANNLPVISGDEDYKTELSASDKQFIGNLYGPALDKMPEEGEYLPLVEFDCSDNISMTLTMAEDLVIIFDKEAQDFIRFKMPEGSGTYTTTILRNFTENKQRRIIIGEVLEPGEELPTESRALRSFDSRDMQNAGNVVFKRVNQALEYIRFVGGQYFKSQIFEFDGFQSLRELYLVCILNSGIRISACPKLQKLGTSRDIWLPDFISEASSAPAAQKTNAQAQVDPMYSLPILIWPYGGELQYSLSNSLISGLQIVNCPNLQYISLENTRMRSLDFSRMPNLKYVYLSSAPEYIVGGGTTSKRGSYLVDALQTLPDPSGKNTGVVLLRCVSDHITNGVSYDYDQVPLNARYLQAIELFQQSKNWKIYWPSGYGILKEYAE